MILVFDDHIAVSGFMDSILDQLFVKLQFLSIRHSNENLPLAGNFPFRNNPPSLWR